MSFVKVAAWSCLMSLALAPAWAGLSSEDQVTKESGPPVDESRRFSLGLADLDLENPGRFRLAATAGEAVKVERDEAGSVDLGGGISAALVYTAENRVPEALKMSFKPKTWDDFDGWEKLGYVLTKTGAAAGAAYLLYRIVD